MQGHFVRRAVRWCGDVVVWWCGDRNLHYTKLHAVRVLKTGTLIATGGRFTSSFRLLLARRLQQALKYRLFFLLDRYKNWPKAPPGDLPTSRRRPRVGEV